MTSLRSVLYVLVFIISLLLLSVRFLHTKCYNDILTDDFVPDERYTDYLENDRMEDVDVYALWKHYDSLSISYSYWAVSESIILDRDIYYYTEPDVHSEIMYTLKAGERTIYSTYERGHFMNTSINWGFFWDQMGVIIIAAAVIFILIIIWLLWRHFHYRKVVTDAMVSKVRELNDSYPIMYVARKSMLAWGVQKIDVTFITCDNNGQQGQVILRTPETKAEKLINGMKGRLSYLGSEFISFVPESQKKPI